MKSKLDEKEGRYAPASSFRGLASTKNKIFLKPLLRAFFENLGSGHDTRDIVEAIPVYFALCELSSQDFKLDPDRWLQWAASEGIK